MDINNDGKICFQEFI
jgi:plastin-1